MDVLDDAGNLKGVRPLGGSVEFGETWQVTLAREFKEELDIDVQITSAPMVFENIFSHEGSVGHEVLFLADVAFPKGAFEGQDQVIFAEDSGELCRASWWALDDLKAQYIPLYPDGLMDALAKR